MLAASSIHPFSSLCTDIDECMEKTALCNQRCTNTEPHYLCSCEEGYELSQDKVTCVGECDGMATAHPLKVLFVVCWFDNCTILCVDINECD